MKKLIILIPIIFLCSCKPLTKMYVITNVETKNQHQKLTVKGIHDPIELPLCNTYKPGDSIPSKYFPKKFLYK